MTGVQRDCTNALKGVMPPRCHSYELRPPVQIYRNLATDRTHVYRRDPSIMRPETPLFVMTPRLLHSHVSLVPVEHVQLGVNASE